MGQRIAEPVLRVLSASVCDGPLLRLPPQLDRALYLDTNKVLQALGGKWDRRQQGHLFAEDAKDRVEGALLTGSYERPADFGFFPTPPQLVARLVELADVRPGMRVLEPSAGHGAIADVLYDRTGERPTVVELVPACRAILEAKGYAVAHDDFLTFWPAERFDRIVANPPFGKQADIAHVWRMWELLAPSGRLVSVMAAGVTFREDRKSQELRALIERYGRWERNPEDAFKAAGTSVSTVTVVLDRPRGNEGAP